MPFCLRHVLTRIRISAHSLRILTGRYSRQRLPRNKRICLCCNTREIECEFHFILICPCYQQLRRIYSNQYYFNRPSVFKFIQLLQIENKDDLCKLAIYYQNAYDVRTSTLNNII